LQSAVERRRREEEEKRGEKSCCKEKKEGESKQNKTPKRQDVQIQDQRPSLLFG